MGSFLAKYILFEQQKYRRVIFHDTLKSYSNFEEKLIFGLKNDIKNVANFYQSTCKCQN